jgi:NTP pyrophosphatase (non-canonical NTP hydrolase)
MEPKDLGIDELCKLSAQIAKDHGWENDLPTQLLLAHSELSEAVEEFRDHAGLTEIWYSHTIKTGRRNKTTIEVDAGTVDAKPEGIPIELADCIIRICDWCGQNGVDLKEAIRIKMEYNKSRPMRHGGKKI